MNVIEAIRDGWAWTGIDPEEVVLDNDFGSLIVRDTQGRYWRICLEDCYCRIVAADRSELERVCVDQAFLRDWHMSALVDQACLKVGALPLGRTYCLRIPGVLGGEYGGDNLATAPLEDVIRFAGDVARQIDTLPDGATIRLKSSTERDT